MHGHLVAVEVGVEGGADQGVKLDRLTLDQLRFERLDTKTVQRRRAVEHNRVFADHLFEDIPHLRLFAFHHPLGLLDGAGQPFGVEARIDKRLEELKRHLLGKTALMKLQIRADDDN